jgi:hypothetical protein
VLRFELFRADPWRKPAADRHDDAPPLSDLSNVSWGVTALHHDLPAKSETPKIEIANG